MKNVCDIQFKKSPLQLRRAFWNIKVIFLLQYTAKGMKVYFLLSIAPKDECA